MTQDLRSEEHYDYGNDTIVIRKYIDGVKGGVVLDVEGFSLDVIKEGHIIIRTTNHKTYKPLNVVGGQYVALPEGYEYVGVSTTTTLSTDPQIGVMYNGEVNDVASPYPVENIKTAFCSATNIRFEHD